MIAGLHHEEVTPRDLLGAFAGDLLLLYVQPPFQTATAGGATFFIAATIRDKAE
jgi:hypothetical protein